MAKRTPPDKEAARRGGLASAAKRAAQKKIRSDVRARQKFEAAAEKMAGVLIDAALGNGVFSELDPKERAQFAVKVLEYGVGRPRQSEPQQAPEEEKGPGLSFSIGAPQGELIPPEKEEDPDA